MQSTKIILLNSSRHVARFNASIKSKHHAERGSEHFCCCCREMKRRMNDTDLSNENETNNDNRHNAIHQLFLALIFASADTASNFSDVFLLLFCCHLICRRHILSTSTCNTIDLCAIEAFVLTTIYLLFVSCANCEWIIISQPLICIKIGPGACQIQIVGTNLCTAIGHEPRDGGVEDMHEDNTKNPQKWIAGRDSTLHLRSTTNSGESADRCRHHNN